jgi:hypothetical protein
MSQENVAVLRRGYESWNRGDRDAAFEFLEPEFELQLPEGGMNVGSFQGREGATKLFEDYLEVFDFFHMEPEEFFEARRAPQGSQRAPWPLGRRNHARHLLACHSGSITSARATSVK